MGPKREYLEAARAILAATPEHKGRSEYDLAYALQAAAEEWFKAPVQDDGAF